MKRLLLLVLVVSLFGVMSCAKETSLDLEDGLYFAQEDEFAGNGWKYMVTFKVEDGKIVSVDWNGANKASGPDKKTLSEAGGYPMVANGGAQSEWHEQAALTEEWLIENQDPSKMEYTDDDGHTDAISGVSIHVVEFFDLVEKAIEAGPASRGPYKDGYYHAEEPEFNRGWKYEADVTVVFGHIVAASWNGIPEEGDVDKKTASENGDYGMVANGGAQKPWFEQAELTEAWLLESQDPTKINYIDEDGHTDTISGVSIHVVEFLDLVKEALGM